MKGLSQSLVSALGLTMICSNAMAAPAARAQDPPRASLYGIVFDAMGGIVPFASVLDTVSRRHSMTDERGRFWLPGLPAKVVIRILAVGMGRVDVPLELTPGDTTLHAFQLVGPEFPRFQAIRDSLTRLGRWPPTLDPDLLTRMREATGVRVFRLDPHHPIFTGPPDPAHRIGPWPIVGEARRPARSAVRELVETLRESELYLPKIRGAQKMCGGFQPGIDVRFTGDAGAIDVLLCYACEEFVILDDVKPRTSGDFEKLDVRFARFAKRVFPHDPAFQKLTAAARTSRPGGRAGSRR